MNEYLKIISELYEWISEDDVLISEVVSKEVSQILLTVIYDWWCVGSQEYLGGTKKMHGWQTDYFTLCNYFLTTTMCFDIGVA